MTEKVMQTIFGKYVKSNPPVQTEVYELKIAKGTSIPFSDLKEHQVEALLKAQHENLYHKITDQPWIKDRPYTFTAKKPFDCFSLVKVNAFVIIWFYKPRQRRVFVKIPIDSFVNESKISERKSLTEIRAREIGTEFEAKEI